MRELDLFLRSMLINFACKLTNKSHFQISLMSDDQILKLVEEKFSQLSDDEKQGIIDDVIGPLIYSIFPRRIPIPKDEGMSRYMTLLDQEDHVYQRDDLIYWNSVSFIELSLLIGSGVLVVLIMIIEYVRKYIDPPPPELKRLKLNRDTFPKKGLKDVAETYIREPYIRETHIIFRHNFNFFHIKWDLATEGNRAASERHI